MRKLLAGVVLAVLVAAAGGAYYGLAIYPAQAFRASLDAALRTLPPGTKGSYTGATYGAFSHHATVTGLTFHKDGPDGFDVSADGIEIANPATDFAAAWARAAADPTKLKPGDALFFAGSVAAQNVTYRNAVTTMTVRSIVIARPRVFPWALMHPDVPSVAAAVAELQGRSDPPDANAIMPLLRAECAVVAGVGFDGYEAQEVAVTVTVPATLQTPEETVAYSVKTARSGAYDRGDLAELTVEDVTTYGAMFGNVSLARTAFKGIKAREVAARILDAKAFSPPLLDGLAVQSIDYGSASVTPPKGSPMTIGALKLSDIAFANGVPISATLALDDVHVNTADLQNLVAASNYAMLGIDALTVSLHASYRWDMEKGRIRVEDASVKIAQLGSLTLSFDIDGAGSLEELESSAGLGRATLRYEDASLVGRLIAVYGAQKGFDAQTMRQGLIFLCAAVIVAPGAAPATVAAARALSEFLSSPQSLEVRIAPPQPLSPSELMMLPSLPPIAVIPRLGLVVRANR